MFTGGLTMKSLGDPHSLIAQTCFKNEIFRVHIILFWWDETSSYLHDGRARSSQTITTTPTVDSRTHTRPRTSHINRAKNLVTTDAARSRFDGDNGTKSQPVRNANRRAAAAVEHDQKRWSVPIAGSPTNSGVSHGHAMAGVGNGGRGRRPGAPHARSVRTTTPARIE